MGMPIMKECYRSSIILLTLILTTVISSTTAFAQTPSAKVEKNQAIDLSMLELKSPLQNQKDPIIELKTDLDKKTEAVKTTESKVEEVKKKSEEIVKTKESLSEEIARLKAEIEDAKARIEEKKRIEAEAEQAKLQPVYQSAPVVSYAQTAGNTYAPGYCTWYVKNMKPNLPNSLGNANQWYYSAQAQGLAVGSAPAVGAAAMAIGENHVAYVTAVNGNMITISEMNYGGLYQMNTRTVPASQFLYIY